MLTSASFRCLRCLVALIVALLAVGQASAQRLTDDTIDSIDAKVVRSTTIALGKIETVAPELDRDVQRVSLRVIETLRGAPTPRLEGLAEGRRSMLDLLRQRRVPLMIFVNPRSGRFELVDLEAARTPKYRWEGQSIASWVAVSTEEFQLLQSRAAIERYVRNRLRTVPQDRPEEFTIHPPRGTLGRRWSAAVGFTQVGGLRVPVGPGLERMVVRHLEGEEDHLRRQLTDLLTPFKSEKNIGRLKRWLKDKQYEVLLGPEYNRGFELRGYYRRAIAASTLRRWQVPFDPPLLEEPVSVLSRQLELVIHLPDETDLAWLKEASNLTTLTLRYAPVTELQLAQIASLPRLTSLGFSGLTLPDSALERVTRMRNVKALQFSDMQVPPRWLETLRKMPQLRKLSLLRTQVSTVEVARFRAARPDVEVVHGLD